MDDREPGSGEPGLDPRGRPNLGPEWYPAATDAPPDSPGTLRRRVLVRWSTRLVISGAATNAFAACGSMSTHARGEPPEPNLVVSLLEGVGTLLILLGVIGLLAALVWRLAAK